MGQKRCRAKCRRLKARSIEASWEISQETPIELEKLYVVKPRFSDDSQIDIIQKADCEINKGITDE